MGYTIGETYPATGYPFLSEISVMSWAMLGYSLLILVALAQAWLIGSVLISGLINRFKKNDLILLRYFGASTNMVADKRKLFGTAQIALAVCMTLPLLLGSPDGNIVVVSGLAALGTLVCLIYAEWFIVSESGAGRYFKGLMRGATMVLAAATVLFAAYEKKDGLAFGLDQLFKARDYRDAELSWQLLSDKASPKEGDFAPDFELTGVDGMTRSLSDYFGAKPIFLFFGANSCPPFSQGTLGINELQERYGDRMEFVGVYVREPHPVDGWWLAASRIQQRLFRRSDSRAAIDILQPTTQVQRNHYAARAHANLLNDEIPLLVDSMDDKVNILYTAQPTRIYILDHDGRVLYNQGIGPFSFSPSHAEPVIQEILQERRGGS